MYLKTGKSLIMKFLRHMFRQEILFFSLLRWRMLNLQVLKIFLSEQMLLITAVILTAGLNFSAHSKKWQMQEQKQELKGEDLHIHTPLMHMNKHEIIKLGTELGVDYSLTHSCYDPTADGSSCGECDSCLLRMKGFAEAGVPDPTKYRVK